MIRLIEYPRCSTCVKARKWLQGQEVVFESQHIVDQTPTSAQLSQWIEQSGLPIQSFFNTHGTLYKELGLKDKLSTLSKEDMLALLASNGMLIKRPLLIVNDQVCVGFKETQWEQALQLR
ncbi:MAG: arsenate reductase family protein [Erysipelotrichaceae bacterium]